MVGVYVISLIFLTGAGSFGQPAIKSTTILKPYQKYFWDEKIKSSFAVFKTSITLLWIRPIDHVDSTERWGGVVEVIADVYP
jgi:hypothetical protein